MKKIIKLTESQLKRMVEQTVNQEDNQFFKLIVNQWGDNVKTNRSGKGKEIMLSNGDKVWFYSTGDCYYISKDEKDVTAGEIVPSGTTDFKLVFEDGDSYDSVTEKWTEKAPQTPKPCANQIIDITNGSLLKFGCKTQGVKELQTLLDFKNPTGYFGNITKQRVTDFQKKNNLKVDGVVGPETYKALTPNAVPPPAQDVKEYDDNYDDNDYNELDSLFTKNFDTEDDYDGEMFRGDDEGFSNKMRQNQINKKMRLSSTGLDTYYKGGGNLKSNTIPRDSEGEEVKWSPIRDNEMPLDKYLEKKKMKNLDEDEDITMLDNLLKKD